MSFLHNLLGLPTAKIEYRKLWWQIVITIITFSVVPLVALGAVIYYQFSASYNAKINETLKTLAENRRDSLDLFLDERVSQIISLAHTHTLAQIKDEQYLQEIFYIIQSRSKSYMDLGVIDQDGHHLAYVGPYHYREILKDVNYRNEEWFHAVMSQGFYISDVFLGFRKVPHFIIAVRARQGNWILRATIDSDIIEGLVRAAQVGKWGDAFIINRDNILQTAPRYCGRLLEKPRCPEMESMPDFHQVAGLTLEEIISQGRTFLFAAIPLQKKRWVLVIKEDPSEKLTPLFRTRLYTQLLGLTGVVLILVGAVFVTRAMMGELVEMERKKAVSEDLAFQSSKMAALGKMAAGIAHEINNPLAVILEKAGWLKDLLQEEDLATSPHLREFAETVGKIEQNVARAKKITHRLLSFGRRMEPVTERVDLNQLLNDSIDFLENEARYRNIDIQTDFYENLPVIVSDSSQLQQVFLNIINNAIDAIGKNGVINIKTVHLKKVNQVAVEIHDSGPGIPKEMLPKIFDPFFTTKEVGKGTGLGLSISYSIIEKLGGRMMVASEPGEGTTFTIYLPIGMELGPV